MYEIVFLACSRAAYKGSVFEHRHPWLCVEYFLWSEPSWSLFVSRCLYWQWSVHCLQQQCTFEVYIFACKAKGPCANIYICISLMEVLQLHSFEQCWDWFSSYNGRKKGMNLSPIMKTRQASTNADCFFDINEHSFRNYEAPPNVEAVSLSWKLSYDCLQSYQLINLGIPYEAVLLTKVGLLWIPDWVALKLRLLWTSLQKESMAEVFRYCCTILFCIPFHNLLMLCPAQKQERNLQHQYINILVMWLPKKLHKKHLLANKHLNF